MPNQQTAEPAADPLHETWGANSGNGLPLLAAAALQDNLLIATSELDRLQLLLAEACATLTQSFHGAAAGLQAMAEAPAAQGAALNAARQHIGQAVIALQFQDMAAQLVGHTIRRLRSCADRIAEESMGDDDGPGVIEAAPERPNPVVQDDMSAGSVELF